MAPKSSIFEEIASKTVDELRSSELFSESMIFEIAQLFESGEIADASRVIGVFQGEANEASSTDNQQYPGHSPI